MSPIFFSVDVPFFGSSGFGLVSLFTLFFCEFVVPIYAYKCSACGHAKDVLQKMSDAPLTTCPECGQSTFSKQVTAAGFQLKGSGWYVTDFRGGGNGAATAPAKSDAGGAGQSAAPPAAAPASSSSEGSAA
ncbi:regulatory protein, FmdB family domain-containing protein 2 [Advenella kashmirensis WT001]|uniref:Regulatory protein, FmdB family domain-containing protein 2 n=1 Tax=Advenella kashmirensis (strain DSM 17095 / LMG 22695 / WT001) TaxID=1036672 RepID=I3U8R5_ADVKW|nr:regulatory protein, FmdB family domain-containing protein 2 [Advenella kashmirensis WT001]